MRRIGWSAQWSALQSRCASNQPHEQTLAVQQQGMGVPAPLAWAISIGSRCWPLTRNSKCRSGGGLPGGADGTNGFALAPLALAHIDATQVGIHSFVAVAVANEDDVTAVFALRQSPPRHRPQYARACPWCNSPRRCARA